MGTYTSPTDLTTKLSQLGRRPNKGLSQNFLIDNNIINKIIKHAELSSEDCVIEIGSGTGSLTKALLAQGCLVIAIEKDKALAESLRPLEKEGHFYLFNEDILKFPLRETVDRIVKQNRRVKIIANLPYHITTPILIKFLPLHDLIHSLTVMVQKEVAMRMKSLENCSTYSSLSLFVRYHADIRSSFDVSANCFYPKPKVVSTVVHLTLKSPLSHPYPENLIRTAFQQRRKMLRKSLKNLYSPDQLEKAMTTVGLLSSMRPEELSLESFIALDRALSTPCHEKQTI